MGSTSLWIHQKGHARFRKWISGVEAGDGEWNLVVDSGATPSFRQKSGLRMIISPTAVISLTAWGGIGIKNSSVVG